MSDSTPDAMLRVAQLTAPGRFGGVETVVHQLSSGLRRRGHELRVICRLDVDVEAASHPFVRGLERADVEVETFSLPHRAYLRECREIAARLRAFRADVVHTHGYHADVVGGLAARGLRLPHVATAHGFTGGGWKNRLFEYLQRRAYRHASAIVAVSAPIAERLARDPRVAPSIVQLRNAWVRAIGRPGRAEARSILGLPADGAVAGWVGRMSREKGPDVAVAALDDPAAEGVTLCMVGDGPLGGEAGGAGSRVVWTGAVPDAGRLLAAFDVLVLSSRTEGTPMVLLEAMDAGIPIVATRVGGVPDVLGPGEALLVPPEDPAALRRAVLETLAEPAVARERAARAAERLEAEFGPDPWLAAHERIYRRAIAAGSRGGA